MTCMAPACMGNSSGLSKVIVAKNGIRFWRAKRVKLNLIIDMCIETQVSCLPVVSHTAAAR